MLNHSRQTQKPHNLLFHLFEVQKQAKRIYCVRIIGVSGMVAPWWEEDIHAWSFGSADFPILDFLLFFVCSECEK